VLKADKLNNKPCNAYRGYTALMHQQWIEEVALGENYKWIEKNVGVIHETFSNTNICIRTMVQCPKHNQVDKTITQNTVFSLFLCFGHSMLSYIYAHVSIKYY
jgi:hypothetical protein